MIVNENMKPRICVILHEKEEIKQRQCGRKEDATNEKKDSQA